MLIDILAPVGEHRSRNVTTSRGKRAERKAKKTEKKADVKSTLYVDDSLSSQVEVTPEISKHVTLGFNSTMRYLESLAKKSVLIAHEAPVQLPADTSSMREPVETTKTNAAPATLESLAAVFIPDQSSKLFAQLPILVQAGCRCEPASLATRLVVLPRTAEAKLGAALQIPRVGIIGLSQGAPAASELIEIIRTRVPPVQVPWLDQAVAGVYLPLNIEQTTNVKSHQLKRNRLSEDVDVET